MAFGATVKVNLKGLEKKVSPQAFARGKLALTNQMLLDMDPFIPFKKGKLRASGRAQKDKVIYTGPHARPQFYGSSYGNGGKKIFKKYTTPGTGKRWDMKASAKHGDEWAGVALKGMGIKK